MKKGKVLFAGAYIDRDQMIEEARNLIREKEYTPDEVRIADRDGVIVVVVK